MARKKQPPPATPKNQGLGPPGANPLFFGVLLAVGVGVVVALSAGDAEWFRSNALYRMGVGALATGIAYVVVAALWLGWHRRVFKKLGALGAAIEMPDQETAQEVDARDSEVADFMDTTTAAINELGKHVEALEDDSGD
jgi:hypothetical protein